MDRIRHDVFLSCKGGSAIETHAKPLVSALKKAQLETFFYEDYRVPGGIIKEKIETALKNSRSAVILLSTNYADSYWCLEELRLILKRVKSSVFPLQIIYCEGVTYRDLLYEENSNYYKALVERHKNVPAKKIEKWKKALKDAGSREGRNAEKDKQELEKFFEEIAEHIKKEISESSKVPLQPERPRKSIGPSGVPDPPDFITGLDDSINIVKGMLLSDPDDQVVPYSVDELSLQKLIIISAPPGCGKTTLAKKLCRDPEIEGRYKSIFFVPVSQKVNITVIVQRIYKHDSESDVPPPIANDEDALYQLEILINKLAAEGVLLVLDDVWSPETLVRKFTFKVSGYKLLVTSRSKHPSFERSTYHLQPLCSDDAKILFRHSAGCTETGGWQDEFVDEIVKVCDGFPLVLTVVGRILRGTQYYTWLATMGRWSNGQANVVNSDEDLLAKLKASVDALDEKMTECFLDLGMFPEDQRIPTNALIDIWAVLYGFDENGVHTLDMLSKLACRNLVNLVTMRQGAPSDSNNPGQFVTLHDLLQKLAIYMSEEEEQTKRLIMEINGDGLCNVRAKENMQRARLLSLTTTGDSLSPNWSAKQLDMYHMVQVLVLNLITSDYSLPKLGNLIQLKALVITNYCSAPAEISDFAHMTDGLSNLERIRLEYVSVPSLSTSVVRLLNLKKISLNLCKIDKALDSWIDKFPNLEEIEIYCCPDLDHLPAGICNLIGLKKLTVTSCNDLLKLPDKLGKLISLQHLKLNSCTKLEALPESIGGLTKLSALGISDCVNITTLPEQVGQLEGLRMLEMQGCWGFVDLPSSVGALNKTTVIVDESNSFLWQDYKNVKLRVVKPVRSLAWLHNLRK